MIHIQDLLLDFRTELAEKITAGLMWSHFLLINIYEKMEKELLDFYENLRQWKK
jgi:hypothetical protein